MGRQFLLKAREASTALPISDKDLVPQPLTMIFGTLQWSWGLNLIGMLTTPKGSERSPRKSRQTLYNLLTLNSNPRKKSDMVKLALEFGHSRDSKHFQTLPNSISVYQWTLLEQRLVSCWWRTCDTYRIRADSAKCTEAEYIHML
jgi:hypothetical protein